MIDKENLPKGWTIAKLGELCKLKNGYAFKKPDYRSTGVPIVRIGNINDGLVSIDNSAMVAPNQIYQDYIIHHNEILIAMSGATTGKFGIYKGEQLVYQNQRVGKFELFDKTMIEQKFLFYFLYLLKGEILKDAYGGAQPNISSSKIENFPIPIAPLPEQTRILTKLEQLLTDLDKGIEYLETTKQQLKVYRQAVLKWAFEGKLTNKNVNDGELPSTWSIKSIKELGKIKGGKRLPPKHKYSESKTEYMYIMAGNLKNGTVTNTPTYIKKETFEVLKNYRVTGGEVYITIVGACIGDAGIIPDNLGNAILTENAAKIIELNSITNKYLAFYINSGDCQKQIDSNILSATLGKLALTRIATIQIPTPANISEQNKIVQEIESRLSVCDKIEETIESSLQQAEALRLSIIKKAFEGKLVPQDPNDEPAEELLERIRAAKGGKAALKGRSKLTKGVALRSRKTNEGSSPSKQEN